MQNYAGEELCNGKIAKKKCNVENKKRTTRLPSTVTVSTCRPTWLPEIIRLQADWNIQFEVNYMFRETIFSHLILCEIPLTFPVSAHTAYAMNSNSGDVLRRRFERKACFSPTGNSRPNCISTCTSCHYFFSRSYAFWIAIKNAEW